MTLRFTSYTTDCIVQRSAELEALRKEYNESIANE